MNVITEIERLRYFAYLNGVADGLKESRNDINSVLDNIRAEIEQIEEGISSYHNDRPWIFKDEVLQIINKHIREERTNE